jgi:hypothetical protein
MVSDNVSSTIKWTGLWVLHFELFSGVFEEHKFNPTRTTTRYFPLFKIFFNLCRGEGVIFS